MSIDLKKGLYILSLDAKDIFIANNYQDRSNELGYNIRYANGDRNTKKFINTLDYSLDLIKLQEIYEQVYNRHDFAFESHGKGYTQHVINVTFKYANKQYNRIRKGLYIKFGYAYDAINLQDCVDVRNGELIAIQCDCDIDKPVDDSMLGKYFYFQDGQYKAKTNIGILHSVNRLREILYRDGFNCDGIHYIRYKRSSGSSRVGKCLFIDENLYPLMHRWETMNLGVEQGQEIDLASFEAYISLTNSSIIDTVEIYPQNILVVDDYDSVFNDDVIAVSEDNDGWLHSRRETIEVSNSIWDGQSLMDSSLFGNYRQYGFLLLRNRFFKSACFNCEVQQWFADHGITSVEQLNGFTFAKDIADIKLITTKSSIKYAKFGDIQEWLCNVDPIFGIVKHDKPTHFLDGKMVQCHYQLINTLQMDEDEVAAFLKPTLDYITLLKSDPAAVRYHIQFPLDAEFNDRPLLTKNDIVFAFLSLNDRFCETKIYRDFLTDLIKSMIKNTRLGHVRIEGNYSTLLGNGIEMLQQSIGIFKGKSVIPVGAVHTKRFDYGDVILASRSPHVCNGNVWLPLNVANEEIDKYFNMTNEIIYVNSIDANILQRLNGADFDSDTVMITNNSYLIAAAQKNYDKFLVPTCLVKAKKLKRYYNSAQQADLDIKTSVNKIGEIINLSQELNTQLWHKLNNGASYDDIDDLYCDIAKLAVMSNLEIDKAKKEFVVDNAREIKKIKQKYNLTSDDGRQLKPNFFGYVARTKGYYDSARKKYHRHKTAMDYLEKVVNKYQVQKTSKKNLILLSELLDFGDWNPHRVRYSQVRRIMKYVRESRGYVQSIWMDTDVTLTNEKKHQLTVDEEARTIEYISSIDMNSHTMLYLVREIDNPRNSDISRYLLHVLFGSPNYAFFDLIKRGEETIYKLCPEEEFNLTEDDLYQHPQCFFHPIDVYGHNFRYLPIKDGEYRCGM